MGGFCCQIKNMLTVFNTSHQGLNMMKLNEFIECNKSADVNIQSEAAEKGSQ